MYCMGAVLRKMLCFIVAWCAVLCSVVKCSEVACGGYLACIVRGWRHGGGPQKMLCFIVVCSDVRWREVPCGGYLSTLPRLLWSLLTFITDSSCQMQLDPQNGQHSFGKCTLVS